jgi:hypothetical protein
LQVLPRGILFGAVPVGERRLTQESREIGRLVEYGDQRAAGTGDGDGLKQPHLAILFDHGFDRT